jgi:hypothetical protein
LLGAPQCVFVAGTSSLRLLNGSASSAGELVQDVFGKHAATEFDPFVHQLKQHVFAFLADRR